ncbi:MAG: nicotinate-nucleotide--dimethylbenzimidazole phosphoribosyltransferase [Runella sp.]
MRIKHKDKPYYQKMPNFDSIAPISRGLFDAIQHQINTKTKPLGALGQLEEIATQVALIQQSLSPTLSNPHLLVFAADHGIAAEGVSAYPQEVTSQMVLNFARGGAAINVFCRQHHISLQVIDAGVKGENFEDIVSIIPQKIGNGTRNFLKEAAMSSLERGLCLKLGGKLIEEIEAKGCNVVGFGEMGIGNTSSAAVLMSLICQIPIEKCVGRGTGIDDKALAHKVEVLKKAIALRTLENPLLKPDAAHFPLVVLATFGGYEIAQMVGAILKAAEKRMVILIDGFIATAAFLVAYALNPYVKDYALFCHQSDEQGHRLMLEFLEVKPILKLNLRLGEGTGAALAYPLVASAVAFFNEMATFESANVTNRPQQI